jgi:hypothetical protein
MGQKDCSPPPRYLREVRQLLDDYMALWLPTDLLEPALAKAFVVGLDPREAAVHICHEHSRRLCRQMIERSDTASDLVEFAIASRIDECGNLAGEMDQDLLDLLPDLPAFVRQPCFSEEFRDMVLHIATWHGIPEHRWSAAEALCGPVGQLAV